MEEAHFEKTVLSVSDCPAGLLPGDRDYAGTHELHVGRMDPYGHQQFPSSSPVLQVLAALQCWLALLLKACPGDQGPYPGNPLWISGPLGHCLSFRKP